MLFGNRLKKSVKIQDVAKVAGVSTATISRALSNPSVVSKATREAVLEAVKVTGYRVNRAARNLRTRKSNAILVLLPDIGNPFFSQILQGIQTVLSPNGFSMLIAETAQISAAGEHLIDYFNDGRADGMIVFDGGLDRDVARDLIEAPQRNQIVFACEWLDNADFPSVRSANRRGAVEAVMHLIELGHKKIAHVTGPKGNVLTEARHESFVKTLEDNHIPLRNEWVLDGDFHLNSGRIAARKIMDMDEKPTAIFCASDQIACALIAEFSKCNINVPEDMAVIGFDDIELAEHFVPALTTMRQDRLGLGRQAAQILLSRMMNDSEISNSDVIVMDVDLVVRESTAPPRN
jgi:LacI family repressor for deo operon, udp, cdd, tsx, nupC, and nupG